jgi:hypothetical protein
MQQRSWTASCLFAALVLSAGCGAEMSADDGSTDGDDGIIEPPPVPADMTMVRVAHLSPDAPAVDFCVAPVGTTDFIGPVLASIGNPLGIEYTKVTKYLEVPAGQYDVRLTLPNSADCSRMLLPDITGLPALPGGSYVTLAATGLITHDGSGAEFSLRPYVDDLSTSATQGKLTFVHASPGTPAVDVGTSGGIYFTPVFSNVEYGGSDSISLSPFENVELSARASGTASDVIAIKGAALPAGASLTAFAIGQLTSDSKPLGVLICKDRSVHGMNTECSVVGGTPERARIRIAHLSPDAPEVDVCIRPSGTEYPAQPLLASLNSRAGLSFPQVTNYLELPAGSYDVRVVLGSETTCANPAVADTNGVQLTAGLTATVGAIGVLDNSGAAAGNPSFRLAAFADETTTTDGKAKLRFIHASPGTPAVDVGVGSGAGFSAVFTNISFGNVGGFVEVNPFTAPISARATGSHVDALTIPSVTLSPNQIATAIAIGGKSGSHENPLRVLLCSDAAIGAGLLATCAVAQ